MLLLGDRVFGDAAFAPARAEAFDQKNAVLQALTDDLRSDGLEPLHLGFDPSWFGGDFEGTTDASHPNDLGASRMAGKLVPLVERILAPDGN